jgi:hypothetical protein
LACAVCGRSVTAAAWHSFVVFLRSTTSSTLLGLSTVQCDTLREFYDVMAARHCLWHRLNCSTMLQWLGPLHKSPARAYLPSLSACRCVGLLLCSAVRCAVPINSRRQEQQPASAAGQAVPSRHSSTCAAAVTAGAGEAVCSCVLGEGVRGWGGGVQAGHGTGS